MGVGVSVEATLHPAHFPEFKGLPEVFHALGVGVDEVSSYPCSLNGFWCTSKVFAWLLGIFGFCLFVTFMTIALLIAGNLQFRVY